MYNVCTKSSNSYKEMKLVLHVCEKNYRSSIVRDKELFRQLLIRAHKHNKKMEDAKENEEKLREQLAAAVKISLATKQQFDSVRKKVIIYRSILIFMSPALSRAT